MDFNWKFVMDAPQSPHSDESRFLCPWVPQRPCMALYGPLRAIKTGVFARGSHFVSPQEKQLSVRDSIPDWYRHKEIL